MLYQMLEDVKVMISDSVSAPLGPSDGVSSTRNLLSVSWHQAIVVVCAHSDS